MSTRTSAETAALESNSDATASGASGNSVGRAAESVTAGAANDSARTSDADRRATPRADENGHRRTGSAAADEQFDSSTDTASESDSPLTRALDPADCPICGPTESPNAELQGSVEQRSAVATRDDPNETSSTAMESAGARGDGATGGSTRASEPGESTEEISLVTTADKVETSPAETEPVPAGELRGSAGPAAVVDAIETSSATSESAVSDTSAEDVRTASGSAGDRAAVVRLRGARLAYGERMLWDGLDLAVRAGEFIAILGPNGSGKTSLLRMLLGQVAPSAGAVEIAGAPARVGNPHIGYVPQQKTIDAGVRLRGVDLVGLGVDGHRWGLGWRGRKERRRKIAEAVAQVGARHYAHAPLESMSGGEQQRLRVAQALVGDPRVLLCDEPLLSLDMANQRLVAELIDARRRSHDTAVLFVTHEINPVLPLVDRVLYLVDGKFRIGTPDEVMTSEVLSELYRTEVDVLRVRGRLVVVGTGDTMDALGGEQA